MTDQTGDVVIVSDGDIAVTGGDVDVLTLGDITSTIYCPLPVNCIMAGDVDLFYQRSKQYRDFWRLNDRTKMARGGYMAEARTSFTTTTGRGY